MTGTLTRHVRSAFSRGAGYEATPVGGRFQSDAVAGYYLDFSAKTTAPTAAAPEALLPAALAQLALGWWERSLHGATPGADAEFLRVCGLLEAASTRSDAAALWQYHVAVPKYDLPPVWVSALAQGQAASVFVRAFLATGDERHAELALAAVVPLVEEGPSAVRGTLPDGLVLEECPTQPASAILNGWIYAAWGLRDVAIGLESDQCRATYEETLACLQATLERYDTGWWSRYSLYPHRVADLAKHFYHRLHVDQLRVLERLTGDSRFGQTASRWEAYDTPWNRLRAVGHKALFVASGYR